MNTVLTARDIEDIIAKGGDPNVAARDGILTPSARDALRDYANGKRNGACGSEGTLMLSKHENRETDLFACAGNDHCEQFRRECRLVRD